MYNDAHVCMYVCSEVVCNGKKTQLYREDEKKERKKIGGKVVRWWGEKGRKRKKSQNKRRQSKQWRLLATPSPKQQQQQQQQLVGSWKAVGKQQPPLLRERAFPLHLYRVSSSFPSYSISPSYYRR